MYKDSHEVPYNSRVKEAIIGPFSWGQLVWIAPGLFGTFKLAQWIPKIPIDSLLFSRIHWAIPLIIAIVFATFKDRKTNLSLAKLIYTHIALRNRQRTFYYRKKNMSSWELEKWK